MDQDVLYEVFGVGTTTSLATDETTEVAEPEITMTPEIGGEPAPSRPSFSTRLLISVFALLMHF